MGEEGVKPEDITIFMHFRTTVIAIVLFLFRSVRSRAPEARREDRYGQADGATVRGAAQTRLHPRGQIVQARRRVLGRPVSDGQMVQGQRRDQDRRPIQSGDEARHDHADRLQLRSRGSGKVHGDDRKYSRSRISFRIGHCRRLVPDNSRFYIESYKLDYTYDK